MGNSADKSLSWSRIARRIRVPTGFLFAAFYLWAARPTALSIVIGSVIAAPGIWLRAIAAGHIRKNAELTTTGPYSYTRNPLYLGSVTIAFGFAVASRSLWVAAAALLFLLLVYLPVIRNEEEFLRETFPGFDEYCRHVPRLFPRLTSYRGASGSMAFSGALYRKHREYNALLGSIVLLLALVAKLWLAAHPTAKAW